MIVLWRLSDEKFSGTYFLSDNENNGFIASLNIILSEPKKGVEYRKGYLADAIANDIDNLNQTKVYLAGPPIMVETCINQLRKIGVQDENCHADAFYTEADKALMAEEYE